MKLETGQEIFDPRGTVDTVPRALAPRGRLLGGIRLGVLDNSKWNGARLLKSLVELIGRDLTLEEVRYYKKDTFSRSAPDELLDQIVRENDLALTGIGD